MPSKCKFEGCNKQSAYNTLGKTKPLYCNSHREEGMINVINKRCIFEACNKQPTYNIPGETKRLYCDSHKEDGMVNVINKRCIFEGCNKQASFNTLVEKSGLYCNSHKEDGMVNVKSKKCIFEGCNKLSTYNIPGESKGLYCSSHKKDGMITVIYKRCIIEGCNKIPKFNTQGESKGLYCKSHREEGMIDVRNRRCIFEGCNKQPIYNKEIHLKPLYCNSHKQNGMFDVINKRCKNDWCETFIRNPKYEGYCAYCFINDPKNDDKPIIKNYKTKETAVRDYILEKYPDFTWICDKIIQGGCYKRRPDLMLDLGYQVIIIEVDENQHTSYDCICENKRLMEISQDINHRNLIFIRFNPDSYNTRENKKIKSCWKIDKQSGILLISSQSDWNIRLKVLEETLKYWINNETNKMLECIELFYDGFE